MKDAPDWEKAVGMGAYASLHPPCRARAKTTNEDFLVEEVVNTPGLRSEALPGYYPMFKVEKHSLDTLHMEKELAAALGSSITFGGLKDKRASAVQYVTATGRNPRVRAVLEGKNFRAALIGYVPKPMSRGNVLGNSFRITLRGCCADIESSVEEAFSLAEKMLLPNYFGQQRFGGSGGRTCDIGRSIVKRDFEQAVRLIILEPRKSDDDATKAAREKMAQGRYDEGLRLLPERQDTERLVAGSLSRKPSDSIAALRAVPLKVRRLFVHAYQSLIFNRTLTSAMGAGLDISSYRPGDNWSEPMDGGLATSLTRGVREPAPSDAVPMVQLPGFAYRNYGTRFDPLVEEAMMVDGVRARDFYVDEMQEVSAEGGFRVPHLVVKDMSATFKEETAVLGFTLARGQYATVLLREIVKPDDPADLGSS